MDQVDVGAADVPTADLCKGACKIYLHEQLQSCSHASGRLLSTEAMSLHLGGVYPKKTCLTLEEDIDYAML